MPWLLREGEVLATLEVADSFAGRARGLLGRDGIDGALLIRPDGFVAWRERGRVRDPQTVLSHVVEQIVGRSTSQTGS